MKTHTNFWTSMQQIPCKMRGHECLKYQHVANTIQNERLRCQTIWIPCKMTGSSSKLLQIQSNWHQERNQKQTNLIKQISAILHHYFCAKPLIPPEVPGHPFLKWGTLWALNLTVFFSMLRNPLVDMLTGAESLVVFVLEIVCLYINMIAFVQLYNGVRGEFISKSWYIGYSGYSFCICMYVQNHMFVSLLVMIYVWCC